MQSSKTRTNQPAWLRPITRFWNHGDKMWQGMLRFAAFAVLFLMLAIGFLLWNDSSAARGHYGWNFILPTANPSWNPVKEVFQSWPFLYGTLVTSLTAILLAVPVSLGIAIFLSELCPDWLRIPLGWCIELLAAIPSVVYGLWGLFVFLPVVITPVGTFLGDILGRVPGMNIFLTGPSRRAAPAGWQPVLSWQL